MMELTCTLIIRQLLIALCAQWFGWCLCVKNALNYVNESNSLNSSTEDLTFAFTEGRKLINLSQRKQRYRLSNPGDWMIFRTKSVTKLPVSTIALIAGLGMITKKSSIDSLDADQLAVLYPPWKHQKYIIKKTLELNSHIAGKTALLYSSCRAHRWLNRAAAVVGERATESALNQLGES